MKVKTLSSLPSSTVLFVAIPSSLCSRRFHILYYTLHCSDCSSSFYSLPTSSPFSNRGLLSKHTIISLYQSSSLPGFKKWILSRHHRKTQLRLLVNRSTVLQIRLSLLGLVLALSLNPTFCVSGTSRRRRSTRAFCHFRSYRFDFTFHGY